MQWFKRLGWFAIPVVLIGLLIVGWALKPALLASYLTRHLGVPVAVGSIDLGKTRTAIGNFRMKNPRGYRRREAFKAGKTTVAYAWRHLFQTPSEIDRIALEDVFLSIEFDNILGTKNNWTQILSRLPSHNNKEVVIHRLTVDRLTVEIRGLGLNGGTQTKYVDHIELSEINSQEGFPTHELISQIFGGAGLQQYLQDLVNPVKTLKNFFNPLGN